MNTLVTGAAGFIGAAVCKSLLERGDTVTAADNLSPYYDVALKKARLEDIRKTSGRTETTRRSGFTRDIPEHPRKSDFSRDIPESPEHNIAAKAAPATPPTHGASFTFHTLDLADREATADLFAENTFDAVIHLAAQPGVRYSIDHPHSYADANLVAFLNVLEGCRHGGVKHLVFASSSSVYGANTRMPYSVGDNVDHPFSLYAATKKSNELMAHAYAHLYGLPCTGLRFFTVYGPWGRPDMALVLFTKAILAGEPIKVFNHGKHRRDFTYIDDIVEGVVCAVDRPAQPNPDWDPADPDPASSSDPWRVYNIGSNNPVELGRFIETLENALGKKAVKELLPLQPGDVPDTYANVDSLVNDIGYRPSTPLEEGIANFVAWYRDYYSL